MIVNYKYITKMRKIMGKKYEAYYPEKHSTIEGLVLEIVNLNYDDPWANISNWHTTCIIKKKGSRKWKKLYEGRTSAFYINNHSMVGVGIFRVLFELENKSVRDKKIKQQEIKKLKEEIKIKTKRLKELLNEKNL